MIEISSLQINVVAVLIAAAANSVLGVAWYAKLFAKPWTQEMGYDPNERPGGSARVKGLVLTGIGNLLFAWVLAFYLAGWKFLPGLAEYGPLVLGVNSALSVWIGFFLPVDLARIVWEKHSWKLFLINSGYHLVGTIIVAVIIAYGM